MFTHENESVVNLLADAASRNIREMITDMQERGEIEMHDRRTKSERIKQTTNGWKRKKNKMKQTSPGHVIPAPDLREGRKKKSNSPL